MLRLRLAVGLALIVGSRALAAPIPVTGWVGDAHGKPLAGARVTLSPLLASFEKQRLALAGPAPTSPVAPMAPMTPAPAEIRKGTSDPGGSFALAAEAGMWTVRLEAAGAVPVELDLPLVETRELPPFLTSVAEDVGVAVRVVDAQGKPVAAARISVERTSGFESSDSWRPAPRRGETGADGRLRLPRVRGERLKLRAAAPGFATAEVESAEAQVLLRLSPAPPRTVAVRGADGRPVAGALVAAASGLAAAASTDENGRATIFPLPGKPASPVAWTADGRRAKASLPPPGADPAAPLSILLPRPPDRASGQVVDRRDRRPLAGALVWPADDPAAWVRADARGGYALPAPVEKAARFVAEAPGHLRQTAALPPPGRGERALRAPTLALQPAAAVEGVVVDAAGHPLAGVQVNANVPRSPNRIDFTLQTARAKSGPDGRFALRTLVPARPYEITASLRGYAPARLTLAELQPLAVRSGLRLVLQRGRALRGRVVDEAGQPVGSAVVRLSRPAASNPLNDLGDEGASSQQTTDAAGSFEISGLLPARLGLTVTAPGFAPLPRRQVTVPPGEGPFDLPPIRLDRGLSLAGAVVDRRGDPVAGAAIRAGATASGRLPGLERQSGAGSEATTGPDGRFTLTGLPRGTGLAITAEREGFAARTLTGIKPPLAEPLRIVLSPASRLAGEVVDESGAPVSGARVQARGDRTSLTSADFFGSFRGVTADEDGRFELSSVPTGKLTVSASATGFLSASLPLELAPEQSRDDLRIALRRGATVTGRVLAADGTPAVGAVVSLAASGAFGGFSEHGMATDGDGVYLLDAVPPGPRTFTARMEDAAPAVRDLTVQPGENRLDFQLGSGLEVAGRVVDTAGAPLSGARVSLSTGEILPQETASGDDGSFRFGGLRAGTYRLGAQLAGFAPASQELRLAEVPLREIEIRLGGGGAIAGHVGGVPQGQLAQVQMLALPVDMTRFSTPDLNTPELDAKGEYRIAGLAPGEWRVSATLDSRHAEGKVQVPPGGEARLDLDLPGGGFTLTGRLLRAGQPFAGGRVAVRGMEGEAQGTPGFASTDTQGAFRIEGLKAGTYELTVRSFAATVAHRETLEITADREVEIALPASEVRGRVVDADDGSPVAEAEVSLEMQGSGGPVLPGRFGGTQTGPDGAFSLQGGDEGDYRVMAKKEGYAPAESLVHLTPDRGADDVKLVLAPSGGLRLTVNSALGSPPSSVSVAFLDPSGRARLSGSYPVGERGSVRISEAPDGASLLLVAGGDSATAAVAVTVPGPKVAVTLPERTLLTVLVPELAGRPGTANLEITGADGLPYRSLRFGVLFPETRFTDGRADLDNLPPGAWSLRVKGPGGKVWKGTATTAPGAPAQVVLR